MARLKQEKTRLEAGFVAIDPASGEIRAWVGSRDFDVDQFDHVAQAARQPGSTFKPFVYGAALEAGIGPDRSYVDDAVEIPLGNGKVWRPTDMGAAPSGEPMTLRDGLIYSKNTITAQVSQEVGIPRIVALAQAMGVDQSKLDPVPSLALGTSPVTLYEMVSAYATIARVGQYHKPLMIRRITDRHGAVLADFGAETRRALSNDSAVELIDMMRGVVARGTGTLVKSRFGIGADVAGKTGTTQNNTDGWFILMHPNLVAGAWVGFNDSRVTMRSSYWGQGGHNAVLVVGDFFRDVLKARLVDAKATFPPSRRPAPPPPAPAASSPAFQSGEAGALYPVGEAEYRREPPGAGAAPGAAPPAEVVVRRDGASRIVIGDRAGVAKMKSDDAPPKTAEEIGRAIDGMGRDRPTGTPARPPPPAPITDGGHSEGPDSGPPR
jgi:penicillin-binding protein 1A